MVQHLCIQYSVQGGILEFSMEKESLIFKKSLKAQSWMYSELIVYFGTCFFLTYGLLVQQESLQHMQNIRNTGHFLILLDSWFI